MSPNFQYGGQAVIEGVMMRGPDTRAVAVRKPDGTIVVDVKPVSSLTKKYPFLKWPIVRGVVALIEAMVLGIQALTYSANQAAGEEEDEKLSAKEIVFTIAFALGLAILLFVVLPVAAAHLFQNYVQGAFNQNLLEGLFRIAIFLAYIVGIGRLADIKRVFQYHGAEHKVINAYEAGDQLTVERVQRHTVFHPRCGTSFILIVLVIKIFLFSLLGEQVLWWRILSRVLLLPVVAGISYELLKLAGKYADSFVCSIINAPGMFIQKITTGPPEDGQVEVAIAAFEAVQKEGEANVG